MTCNPLEPYILGEDTLLNGRASTFSVVTHTETIVLYANTNAFLKVILDVGNEALETLKKRASFQINEVTRQLLEFKEQLKASKDAGLDFRSPE
jgi:hypothetical protein